MLRYKTMLRAERSNKRETMSLQVNTNLSGKINKTLMLSMTMLALVVQPLYSLVASNVASAGSEFVKSLVFEQTSPTAVIKDEDSSLITVSLKNATGDYQPVDGKVDLVIQSDSNTGRFSEDSKNKNYKESNTLKHSISKDSSTASFYYKDSTTGSPTLTATVSIEIKNVTTEFKDTHVINVLPVKPVDTQAPTISNISFGTTHNTNIGGKVTVYFELSDVTGIDVNRSKVMFQDGPGTSSHPFESEKVSPVLIEGSKYRAEFDTAKFVPNSTVARYALGFNPYDTLGNQSSAKPMSVLIDNSGPTATLVSPSSGSYLNNQIAFTFDINDDSGVKSGYAKLVKIDDDKVQQSATLTQESSGRWQALFDTKTLAEGEYKLDIRPVDVFGQPRYHSGVAKFTVDKTSPTITIKDSSKGKDGYFSKLDLKLFDDKSIKSYQFNEGAIQDVGVNNWSDINDIFPGSWRGLSEGAHSVRVYDLAGNWTDFDFTLDNTAPKYLLKVLPRALATKKTLTLEASSKIKTIVIFG